MERVPNPNGGAQKLLVTSSDHWKTEGGHHFAIDTHLVLGPQQIAGIGRLTVDCKNLDAARALAMAFNEAINRMGPEIIKP